MSDFDYEYLEKCWYPVPYNKSPSQHVACGEPAIARLMWSSAFMLQGKRCADENYVCQKHLNIMLETKEELCACGEPLEHESNTCVGGCG